MTPWSWVLVSAVGAGALLGLGWAIVSSRRGRQVTSR